MFYENDIRANARSIRKEYPQIRYGQSIFMAVSELGLLEDINPPEYEHCDPFYVDNNVPNFFSFLRNKKLIG